MLFISRFFAGLAISITTLNVAASDVGIAPLEHAWAHAQLEDLFHLNTNNNSDTVRIDSVFCKFPNSLDSIPSEVTIEDCLSALQLQSAVDAERELSDQNWISVGIAFFALIAASVAAISTAYAALLLRKTLEQGDLLVSQGSAVVEATNGFGRVQSRAYLAVQSIGLRYDMLCGELELAWNIKNHGNSPASKIDCFFGIELKNGYGDTMAEYFYKKPLSQIPSTSVAMVGAYSIPWISLGSSNPDFDDSIDSIGITAYIRATDIFENTISAASRWFCDNPSPCLLGEELILEEEFGVPECLDEKAIKCLLNEFDELQDNGAPSSWKKTKGVNRAPWSLRSRVVLD